MEPIEEAHVIDDDLMISRTAFEIDMSGIQRDVEDLTAAIDEALTVYGEMLVNPQDIQAMGYTDVRRCERAVSSAVRAADELRRQLNRDYRIPLDVAKQRYDELMGPVIELHRLYRERRLQLDEETKAQKLQAIRQLYEDMASFIALPLEGQDEALVPFERIYDQFGAKWLNKGALLSNIELQISDIAQRIAQGEQQLDAAGLAHALEAKAVYWQTLDVNAAFARDAELCRIEQRQAALAAERAELERLKNSSDEDAQGATADESQDRSPNTEVGNPALDGRLQGNRIPRVMYIDGATDDECRQIGAFCKSIGVSGVIKRR